MASVVINKKHVAPVTLSLHETDSMRSASPSGVAPSTISDSPDVEQRRRILPWIRIVVAGAVLAGLAWVAPWPGPLLVTPFGTVPVRPAAALAGLAAGLTIAGLTEWVWAVVRRRRRMVQQLERRVAQLEAAKIPAAAVRVRFEYDMQMRTARLHVTNDGEGAVFRAPVNVEGALASRLDRSVFAQWEHTNAVDATIQHGETQTLRLASLDITTFPFAQWCVYVATDEGPIPLPAMHASVIGGASDAQAPPLFLEVDVVGTVGLERLYAGTIALYPFEAQKLSN